MKNLFTKEELLKFNEILLQRGIPNTEDGVGFNKSDYMTCSTYFHGLSDSQYSDLAKRLVKYCDTQLKVDKQIMKDTAKTLAEISDPSNRSDGISIDVRENGTLISFRYNDTFIETIKKQPKRQWDSENKNWIIPNGNVIQVLRALEEVGADVKNAIEYAEGHELISTTEIKIEPIEIQVKYDGEMALIKFNYNKDIVDAIKTIPVKDRKWNQDFKFWSVNKKYLQNLQDTLSNKVAFRQI